MSFESVMLSNHLILCHPLLLLPLIYPIIRIFSNESKFHIWWPRYWCFNLSISPSNEYSGLISFNINWFDLVVQEALKSLLQHQSWKASILRCSTFFMILFINAPSWGNKTQRSFSEWINKLWHIHTTENCSGHTHTNQLINAYMTCTMERSQIHYAKWRKPVPKDHMVSGRILSHYWSRFRHFISFFIVVEMF